jgi:hypothetical protein
MTDTNDSRGRQLPRAFAADIPTDLAAGRAVELAEIYALDAISDAEREAIDAYVSGAPEAERASFNERVRQARETLAMSFTAEEEPPADLFARIVAQLPAAAPAAEAGRRWRPRQTRPRMRRLSRPPLLTNFPLPASAVNTTPAGRPP